MSEGSSPPVKSEVSDLVGRVADNKERKKEHRLGLVWFRGLTPQQQPGSYQGGEMMMKSVFWWRKPEHPEETTDLRQVTDETL